MESSQETAIKAAREILAYRGASSSAKEVLEYITSVILRECREAVEQARPEIERAGWYRCLDSVRGSLEGYPNAGGDIEIMKAVTKIERSAKVAALGLTKPLVEVMRCLLTHDMLQRLDGRSERQCVCCEATEQGEGEELSCEHYLSCHFEQAAELLYEIDAELARLRKEGT